MMSGINVTEFCRKLRELARRPVNTHDDLDEWRALARELEASISADLADRIPHFVWHYLTDADIRFREEGYRHDQEQELEAALKEVEDARVV
jgi:hypothetical protein